MFYISDMLLYFEMQTTQGGWGRTFRTFCSPRKNWERDWRSVWM